MGGLERRHWPDSDWRPVRLLGWIAALTLYGYGLVIVVPRFSIEHRVRGRWIVDNVRVLLPHVTIPDPSAAITAQHAAIFKQAEADRAAGK